MLWTTLTILGVVLVASLVLGTWVLGQRYNALLASIRDLDEREKRLQHFFLDNINLFREGVAMMPVPQIVVSQSYFVRTYFSNLLPDWKSRYLRLSLPHELVVSRARRQAVVCLLEQAQQLGFNAVCNLKIETTDVGQSFNANQRAMVIITATGTGYRLE